MMAAVWAYLTIWFHGDFCTTCGDTQEETPL